MSSSSHQPNIKQANTRVKILIIFSMVLVFQLTCIKFTLNLVDLSRLINLIVMVGLSVKAAKNVINGVFEQNVLKSYALPGIMIYTGFLLNMILSGATSAFGLLIPWAAYLSVPLLIRSVIDSETIWLFFYRFMLITTIIGLLEYNLVSMDVLSFRIIETPYGEFGSSLISIFHVIYDGSAYYRFYSVFLEPGTLSMFLLPAILYALNYGKFIGLTVFALAFFLTDSLGGYISLMILVLVYILMKLKQSGFAIGLASFFVLIFAIGIISFASPYISASYVQKDNSATVREKNASVTIQNLPNLMFKYPLGMRLPSGGGSFSEINNSDFSGSNFSPGVALITGGVIAFFGYMRVLINCIIIPIVSLMKPERKYGLDTLVVFPSLIVTFPFVFQRTTFLESASFAFLFAPSLLRYLQSNETTIQSKYSTYSSYEVHPKP